MAIHFTPIDEEKDQGAVATQPTPKQPTIHFVPVEGSLSRKDLSNFGVTAKTNAKQREVITNVLRRQAQERPIIKAQAKEAQQRPGAFPGLADIAKEAKRVPEPDEQGPPVAPDPTRDFQTMVESIQKNPSIEPSKKPALIEAEIIKRQQARAGELIGGVQGEFDQEELRQRLGGKFLKKTGLRLQRGAANIASGALSFVGTATKLATGEKYGDTPLEWARLYHDAMKAPEFRPLEENVFDKFFGAAAETAPFLIIGGSGAIATGGTAIPSFITSFATSFMVEGGSAYQTALDRGLDEREARKRGALVGLVNAGIEVVGGGGAKFFNKGKVTTKALSRLGRGKQFSKRLIKNALSEGLEEGLQETSSILLGGDIPLEEDGTPDFDAMATRIVDSWVAGVVLGTGFSGVQGGLSAVKQYGSKRQQTKAEESINRILDAQQEPGKPTELTPLGFPAKFQTPQAPGAAASLQGQPTGAVPPGPAAPAPGAAQTPVEGEVEREKLKADTSVFWHGSPSGDLRGGKQGLHVGTHLAAKQALEARIGIPATGEWDGTREYGKTLLAGKDTLLAKDPKGYNQTGANVGVPKEDYYPTGKAKYSDGSTVSMTAKPNIQPVRIKGDMVNTLTSPKDDFKAGSLMAGQIKKGTAKRGYYYKNVSEDEGSISAVLPSATHIESALTQPPTPTEGKVEVISEESYLATHGASRQKFGDAALHKNIQEGRAKRQALKRMSEKDAALTERREELRKEYQAKVAAGEIRPPTRTERLIETARGQEDNEAVQAARRLLKKQGIDWKAQPPTAKAEGKKARQTLSKPSKVTPPPQVGQAEIVAQAPILAKTQAKEAKTADQAIGEQQGFTPEETQARLDKAETRFRELKNKPVADRTKAETKELAFLSRNRTDSLALMDRELRGFTREELNARAKQFGIPFRGVKSSAVIKEIKARAEEFRQRQEVTGDFEFKKGEPVNVTPDKLLRFALKREVKGARTGFRAGQIELTATHGELLDFAKKSLPPTEFKLVAKAAGKVVGARTPSEVRKVIRAVNKMVEAHEKASAIKEVKKAISKAQEAKLTPEFQSTLDEMQEEFTLSMPRKKTLDWMESLLEAAERDEHQIGDIPQRLIDQAKVLLANAEKKQLKDYSADELRTITAAVQNLINQDSLKKQLLFTRRFRDRAKAAARATKAVVTRWGKKFAIEPGKFDKKSKLRNAWTYIKNIATWDQLNLDTKSKILGGKDSVAHQILSQNLLEADSDTTEIQNDSLDHVTDTLTKAGVESKTLEKWSHLLGGKKVQLQKVALPEARDERGNRVKELEMTTAERIHFLRFVKDGQNREALLADTNKGITFRRDKNQNAIKLTAQDMKAIMDSASQAEQDIAQALHEYINGRAGKINIRQKVGDVWQKLMGFPLNQRSDYARRERANEHLQFDPTDTTQNFVNKWLHRQGIFKARQRSSAPFVIGDAFAEFSADVNRMAAFAGKALAVNDAMVLLKDQGFRRAVRDGFKDGDGLLNDLEASVRFFNGLDQPAQGSLEHFAKGFIRKAHVGALAAKPHIVLYQTVSLLNAVASDMSAKHLYTPSHFRLKEMRRMRKILNDNSPSLNARERGGTHQLLTPSSAGPTLRTVYGMDKKKLKSIHRADSMVMELLGLAAEAEGKAKGVKNLNKYIAGRVEQIVAETQPSWDATTLSSLAREGRNTAWKHLLVMFSSQRAKNVNIVVSAVNEYMFSEKTAGDKAKLAKKVSIPTIVNATLIYALGTAYWEGLKAIAKLFGRRPKEPEENAWKRHITGIMKRMVGNWIIVGDLVTTGVDAAVGGLEGESTTFLRPRGTVLADFGVNTLKAIRLLARLAAETAKDEKYGDRSPRAGQSKNIKTFWEFVESAGRAAGVATGLPLQGILQIAAPFLPQRQDVEGSGSKTKGTKGTKSSN